MTVRSAFVILITGLVCWLDIATPPYVFVQGFYLLPIFLAAWYCGAYLTILVVVGSSITNLYMSRQVMPESSSILELMLTYSSDLIVFVVFAFLIYFLKHMFDQVHTESRTDALTGLRTLRGFFESAEFEIGCATRYGNVLTLALIDIDNFKHVNDTQGHAVGDRLLVAVSHYLTSILREVDLTARLGGDEFVILLPGGDAAEVTKVLNRLLEGMSFPRNFVFQEIGYNTL